LVNYSRRYGGRLCAAEHSGDIDSKIVCGACNLKHRIPKGNIEPQVAAFRRRNQGSIGNSWRIADVKKL
jgi:hypothetical protein